MKKKLIFLALILISSALILYLSEDKGHRLNVRFQDTSFFEGLKIINKKDGATSWILTARRADLSKDGSVAVLSGVEMLMPSRNITILAEKGTYTMDTRQVSVEGVIKAHNDQYHITASQAVIDSEEGKIETAGDVKIEGRKFNVEGKGMKADNNEQKVRILKNVKAVFN